MLHLHPQLPGELDNVGRHSPDAVPFVHLLKQCHHHMPQAGTKMSTQEPPRRLQRPTLEANCRLLIMQPLTLLISKPRGQ